MSTYNGTFKTDTQHQFYVRRTNKNLIEITEWFSADKIKIGFRTYNLNDEKGSRTTGSVDFYMTIPEFELLCHNILSGKLAKDITSGNKISPIYKGSERNGVVYSRMLTFAKSNVGVFFTACEGPGKKNDTGAVMPLYKPSEAENKVSIPLNFEEMKSFALQGKRACDFYYLHYFGRS